MGERHSEYQRHAEDWYIEPDWCVRALILAEPFTGGVWDPACGIGTIPKAFRAAGWTEESTYASDIAYRGFAYDEMLDFFYAGHYREDNIVSNPPYKLTEAFAREALEHANRKVALLTNIKFLASQKRHKLFTETPVRRVWIMSTRPSMPPGDALMRGEVRAGNGSQDYCWIVWEQGYQGVPEIGWLLKPEGI